MVRISQFILLIFLVLCISVVPGLSAERIYVPDPDTGIESLSARQDVESKILSSSDVFHDFEFSNRRDESSITFETTVVPDATWDYVPAHYDHGTGLAVADVNNDGRLDLYFVNQIGSNALWVNQGDGVFEDWTDSAGVGLKDRVSISASFADLDNDGDPDLYVTGVRTGNVLFENLGDGNFKNVTQESNLGFNGHHSAAIFFDYNRDGRLDLFLTSVGIYTRDQRRDIGSYVAFDTSAFKGHLYSEREKASRLLENKGSLRFEDVTNQVNLSDTGWTGDAHFHDVNGNGYPDLYVLNMQGDDHFYVNQKGERFVERTERFFEKSPWGAMGVKFFDYNNNGLIDLYLTDMHSDMNPAQEPMYENQKYVNERYDPVWEDFSNNIAGNAFWERTGPGEFEEVSSKLGLENYWPWGFSTGDLNANGYQDLFVTASMNYPFRYGINKLYLNDFGRAFYDAEFQLGIEPRKDGPKKLWFTLDCDGSHQSHYHCRGHSGKLEVYANKGSRSSAIFDLDNDGDLDIVTNEFNSEPQVFVSNLTEKRDYDYLKIDLRGTKSNRDGIGSTIRLKTDQDTYYRTYTGKSGYLSQSSLPVFFALSPDETIQSLVIEWPSGTQQRLERNHENLRLNQLNVIRERP